MIKRFGSNLSYLVPSRLIKASTHNSEEVLTIVTNEGSVDKVVDYRVFFLAQEANGRVCPDEKGRYARLD